MLSYNYSRAWFENICVRVCGGVTVGCGIGLMVRVGIGVWVFTFVFVG
jgi:hypothetical protein